MLSKGRSGTVSVADAKKTKRNNVRSTVREEEDSGDPVDIGDVQSCRERPGDSSPTPRCGVWSFSLSCGD